MHCFSALTSKSIYNETMSVNPDNYRHTVHTLLYGKSLCALSCTVFMSKPIMYTWYVESRNLLIVYSLKSETPLSLVLGGIRTHNLLIFGHTVHTLLYGIILCALSCTVFMSKPIMYTWYVECRSLLIIHMNILTNHYRVNLYLIALSDVKAKACIRRWSICL